MNPDPAGHCRSHALIHRLIHRFSDSAGFRAGHSFFSQGYFVVE